MDNPILWQEALIQLGNIAPALARLRLLSCLTPLAIKEGDYVPAATPTVCKGQVSLGVDSPFNLNRLTRHREWQAVKAWLTARYDGEVQLVVCAQQALPQYAKAAEDTEDTKTNAPKSPKPGALSAAAHKSTQSTKSTSAPTHTTIAPQPADGLMRASQNVFAATKRQSAPRKRKHEVLLFPSKAVIGAPNRLAAHCLNELFAEHGHTRCALLYGLKSAGKKYLVRHCLAEYEQTMAHDAIVRTINARDWFQELHYAVANKNAKAFRDKYKSADVLVVYDLQDCFGSKQYTQECLRILKTLRGNGKKVILSYSGESVEAISEWQSVADVCLPVGQPTLDMREAYLRTCCAAYDLRLTARAIKQAAQFAPPQFYALRQKVEALRLSFASEPGQITHQMVNAYQQGAAYDKRESIKSRIVHMVASYYGYEDADILSASRKSGHVAARQVAMRVMQQGAQLSFKEIAHYFGKTASSVRYATDKVARATSQSAQGASRQSKPSAGQAEHNAKHNAERARLAADIAHFLAETQKILQP